MDGWMKSGGGGEGGLIEFLVDGILLLRFSLLCGILFAFNLKILWQLNV